MNHRMGSAGLEKKGRLVATVAMLVCLLPRVAVAQSDAAVAGPARQSPRGATTRPGKAEKPKLVTNVFYETSLRQVLSDIATQVGVIIVPDASVRGIVTCDLKDVPLEEALEIVLAGTGFAVKKMPNYYLVCSTEVESPSFRLISQTRIIKLNYVNADAVAKLLSPGFRDYVQADKETNAVCITGPPALVERIAGDLTLIDRPPRHVMLDARIVVMERSDLLNLGLQWDWPQIFVGTFSDDSWHGGGTRPNWPWGIQIGYTPGREFTNSLVLTLNLLAQNDEATVVARPQLMAQHGKEAEIKVNTEEYFEIVSEGVYITSRLEKIETGTVLRIIPRIGEKGDITLEMATEVSGVIARGENNLPVVTRRTASSTVRIENGGTAAVAGLMDSRTRLSESQVPGLAKLPLLAYLFRNDADVKSSRQVAVFVTARVVPKAGPALAKPGLRRPAIKPVGEEFREALKESLRRLGDGSKKE